MTRPQVPFVVGIVLLVSLIAGLAAERFVRLWVEPEVRAAWMLRAGRRAEAETVLFRALERGPITTERVLAFLQCHGPRGMPHAAPRAPDDDDDDRGVPRSRLPREDVMEVQAISDHDVDALLARPDVPRDTALIARFVRELGEGQDVEALRAEVLQLADAEPPAPWANHLLGREAQLDGKLDVAAHRYLREGVAVEAHSGDVDLALMLVREYDGPEGVRRALEDPRVEARASAYLKLRLAVDLRRWKDAARWSLRGAYQQPALSALVITTFAALAWMAFLARVGAVSERPRVRIPLYFAAFALGVLSIWPTTFLIVAQESVLHLVPRGKPFEDAIFFVLGVGFREEMSKLLLFAPLLLVLRRLDSTPSGITKRETPRGDGTVRLRPGKVPSFPVSVDVVVCGALVGLGFAAEENLAYLEHGDLATGMARFLTANFLHMAMTALTANALYDFTRAPEAHSFDFTTTLFTVILLHGAYDFFLTSHAFGSLSLVAMLVFFVLTRKFINVLSAARRRAGRGMPPFELFALGLGVVSGASFVFSCAMVGPAAAATSMLGGLLGVAIVLFMFASELRRL